MIIRYIYSDKDNMTSPDWEIHAYPTDDDDTRESYTFVTSGFDKYGFGGEVLVLGNKEDGIRIAELINSFCMLLVNGDTFDPSLPHQIDNNDGEPLYKFNVSVFETTEEGVKYQLFPQLK